MKTRNRIVLIDDHHVMRELVRFQLGRSEPDRYEIVGEGSTGQEAVDVCLRDIPGFAAARPHAARHERGGSVPPL